MRVACAGGSWRHEGGRRARQLGGGRVGSGGRQLLRGTHSIVVCEADL